MKKLVILVVVLLAVAGWAGATYVIAGKVENRYHGLIEQNARFGPFSFSSRSYQRGFTSSTAETLVELTVPQPPAEEGAEPTVETLQLVLEHDIAHGPIPFGANRGGGSPALALIETRLVVPEPAAGEFERLLQQVPELRESFSHLRVGFDGRTTGRMEVPPFTREEDGETVRFGGLSMTAAYAPGAGTLAGTVECPGMAARFGDGELSWQGIHGHFDLAEALPLLFVGQSRMVFGGMTMDIPARADGRRSKVDVAEIRIDSDSRYDGRLVHGRQTLACDGVTVDGATYGPLAFDLEMKNFDGRALSDYQQGILDLYREMDVFNPDQAAAALVPLYADLALRLMTDRPELNVNRFHLGTPQGAANGTLQLKYEHPRQEAPADLSALPQYLPYVTAVADLAVDRGLARSVLKSSVQKQVQAAAAAGDRPEMSALEVEALVNRQVDMQLEMFAAQGFIVPEGETIKSRLAFVDGALQVNGNPLSIGGP